MSEKQIETVVDAEAVAAAATEAMFSELLGTYVLPQEQLNQLVATGKLVSVTTFADHMRPDVHWIEPEEYGNSFNDLIAREGNEKMGGEIGFTKGEGTYPGFINATVGLDEMVITMRSDPRTPVMGDKDSLNPGTLAQLRVPLADWDVWIAQAQRLRANAG